MSACIKAFHGHLFELAIDCLDGAIVKCHMVGGSGGNAAPALDGVATRGDARYLLHSLINPNEKVVEGYANAGASAMPSMQSVLTDAEIRDVVAYLSTLR